MIGEFETDGFFLLGVEGERGDVESLPIGYVYLVGGAFGGEPVADGCVVVGDSKIALNLSREEVLLFRDLCCRVLKAMDEAAPQSGLT